MLFVREKTIHFQGSRGVQHFLGGPAFFFLGGGCGGPNAYFYRTPYVTFSGILGLIDVHGRFLDFCIF